MIRKIIHIVGKKCILTNNAVKSVTVVRMEVPCCGGLESAVKNALSRSGKMIPWSVVTLSTDGAARGV